MINKNTILNVNTIIIIIIIIIIIVGKYYHNTINNIQTHTNIYI